MSIFPTTQILSIRRRISHPLRLMRLLLSNMQSLPTVLNFRDTRYRLHHLRRHHYNHHHQPQVLYISQSWRRMISYFLLNTLLNVHCDHVGISLRSTWYLHFEHAHRSSKTLHTGVYFKLGIQMTLRPVMSWPGGGPNGMLSIVIKNQT